MTLSLGSLAVLFGLAAAISWGTSDFSGGMASKKSSSYWVVIFSMLIGTVFLTGAVFIYNEPFPGSMDLIFGVIAGIGGAACFRARSQCGTLYYYRTRRFQVWTGGCLFSEPSRVARLSNACGPVLDREQALRLLSPCLYAD